MVHGSGIMAAVAAGLWVGHHSHGFVDPLVRIEIQAAWRVVGFALNSLLFMLVGLQTRDIIDTVDQPMGRVLLTGAAVTVAVIGIRLLWALTIAPAWRGTARRAGRNVRAPSSRPFRIVLGWSGVRGSVALAAALAIPISLDAGGPLPGRELAIVLTLFVIVATLLIQGLTLRPLVRRMGLTDPGAVEREKRLALQTASEVALKQLPEAAERNGLDERGASTGWSASTSYATCGRPTTKPTPRRPTGRPRGRRPHRRRAAQRGPRGGARARGRGRGAQRRRPGGHPPARPELGAPAPLSAVRCRSRC